MKLEITGNPGTGNTYNETHVQLGDHSTYAPHATTVEHHYHYGEPPMAKVSVTKQEQRLTEERKAELRSMIVDYVCRLLSFVKEEWSVLTERQITRYQHLWETMLKIPALDPVIFQPGKQQDTCFNRDLVAHLIYYIGKHGVFNTNNVSNLAEALEGNKQHAVRKSLGLPPERDLQKHLDAALSF